MWRFSPVVMTVVVLALGAGCQSDQTVKAARAYGEAAALASYGARPGQTAMLRMARGVEALQAALRSGGDGGLDVTAVDGQLAELEAAAGGFAQDASLRAHPAMQRDYATLLGELAAARAALRETPPRVEPAQGITGACYQCHARSN